MDRPAAGGNSIYSLVLHFAACLRYRRIDFPVPGADPHGDEMSQSESPELLKLASEIVVAFLAQRAIEPDQLPPLIRAVRAALSAQLDPETIGAESTGRIGSAWPPAGHQELSSAADDVVVALVEGRVADPPPADPARTVFDDYLICLEDGKRYRSLRRHLMAKYGMSPDE